MTKNKSKKATAAAGSKKLAAPAPARVKAAKPRNIPAAREVPGRGSFKRFVGSRAGGACIVGKEYIQLVDCSAATEFSRLIVNPASEALCPLLAADAKRFEKYRFTRLAFSFETTSPSTKGGELAMGFMINPDVNALPLTFLDVTNLGPGRAVSGGPWTSKRLVVPSKDLSRILLVNRSASLAATQIASSYSPGDFFLVTSGGDGSVCGLLAVEYECEFDGQFVGTGEVPTSFQVTKTGAPTDATNLVKGTSLGSAVQDVEWALESLDASTTVLTPVTINRGIWEIEAVGTGFDATSDFSAVAGTGDLINIADVDADALVSSDATKIVQRFAVTALPDGASQSGGTNYGNPLDWLKFAFAGAGAITAYTLTFLKEAYLGGPTFKDYLPPLASLGFAGISTAASARLIHLLRHKKCPRLDHDTHRAIRAHITSLRRRQEDQSIAESTALSYISALDPQKRSAFLKRLKRLSLTETPS